MTKHDFREFVDSSVVSMKVDMLPIDYYEDLFKESGYEIEDLEDNTNGWSVGFWYYFTREGKPKIMLSGSLWYGGFKITKV